MARGNATIERLWFAAVVTAAAICPLLIIGWFISDDPDAWRNLINAFNRPPLEPDKLASPGRSDYFESFDDWPIGLAMGLLTFALVWLAWPRGQDEP